MTNKTELEISIEQATAALQGNETHITTHKVPLDAPYYNAQEIKQIRAKLDTTQRVFANYLGVSSRTVESWESGKSRPSRSASRLIQLIDKRPTILDLID